MHKPLSVTERAKLQLAEKIAPMTRREKLLRLAEIARNGRPSVLKTVLKTLGWERYYENNWSIFHSLEHMHPSDLLRAFSPASVFDAALKDPVLYDAGLRADQGDSVSAARAMQFFELKQQELHEFSCNCGGAVSNEQMAARIEKLAG